MPVLRVAGGDEVSLPAGIVADLIGKPYADRGRGPDAYDCEGLFLELQRRRGYSGTAQSGDQTQRALAWLRIVGRDWVQLQHPQPGCAVFFAGDLHVGTMYDRVRFLHTSSELGGAFLDRLDSPHWKGKKPLFYDWRAA